MKKYIAPQIKAVQLASQQAILQVCQLDGGVWMLDGAGICVHEGSMFASGGCTSGNAKGATFVSVAFNSSDNLPGS